MFIRQSWQKASYSDFFYVFQNLKYKLEEDGIDSISIPNFENDKNLFKYEKLKHIIQFIFRNSKIKIIVHHDTIINLERSGIPIILKENHDDPQSGHSGFRRTFNRIKEFYYWKHMKSEIKAYIKSCESCQKNTTLRRTFKAPMEITTTASQPFEKLSLDIEGPLPLTINENQFILTLQDDLNKYSQAFPLKNHSAETVANKLFKFISFYGIPNSIFTDQGSEFMSSLLKLN